MKFIKQLTLMAAGILVLAACQSKNYHISGTVEGAADGEKLYLTTDMDHGIPCDSVVIHNGKFELSGEADSVRFCMLYGVDHEELSASFFLEPGRIQLKVSTNPTTGRVGGTAINDEWQRLNDSIMVVAIDINRLAEKVYEHEAPEAEQQRAMAQMEQLNRRFGTIVIGFIKRNIHNELGYFLLTFYPDDILPNSERRQLIKLLPDDMRQRPLIRQMEEHLGATANTEEGAVMEDFTLLNLAGSPVSVMSEVRKNKITILDFWASWCAPCRRQMPKMKEIYSRYRDRGLGIIGISVDDDADEWKQAVEQLSLPWIQLSDLKGDNSEVGISFGFHNIPFVIVVDQQGKILRRGLRGHALEDFVANELKK